MKKTNNNNNNNNNNNDKKTSKSKREPLSMDAEDIGSCGGGTTEEPLTSPSVSNRNFVLETLQRYNERGTSGHHHHHQQQQQHDEREYNKITKESKMVAATATAATAVAKAPLSKAKKKNTGKSSDVYRTSLSSSSFKASISSAPPPKFSNGTNNNYDNERTTEEDENKDKEELERKRLASRISSRKTREREKLRVDHYRNSKHRLEQANEQLRKDNQELREAIRRRRQDLSSTSSLGNSMSVAQSALLAGIALQALLPPTSSNNTLLSPTIAIATATSTTTTAPVGNGALPTNAMTQLLNLIQPALQQQQQHVPPTFQQNLYHNMPAPGLDNTKKNSVNIGNMNSITSGTYLQQQQQQQQQHQLQQPKQPLIAPLQAQVMSQLDPAALLLLLKQLSPTALDSTNAVDTNRAFQIANNNADHVTNNTATTNNINHNLLASLLSASLNGSISHYPPFNNRRNSTASNPYANHHEQQQQSNNNGNGP